MKPEAFPAPDGADALIAALSFTPNLGDGIAAGGGSDRMVLHPMLRIPCRTPHNTSSLRRIDSPPCCRSDAAKDRDRPRA